MVRKKAIFIIFLGVLLLVIGIAFAGYKERTVTKIGLILTGEKADYGWNGVHYDGVAYACERFGAQLLVKENVLEGTGRCIEAVQELASEGASMIILSSYAYPEEVKDVVGTYPDIAFYGISAENYAENMTSYFGRMYQARYLAGIIAGLQTKSNQIGYVAAMPNIEVNRGINAFTLGVKKVNSDAKVYVKWTNSWDNEEAERKAADELIAQKGADVLTYHQNQHYTARTADEAGICSIGYNEKADHISEKYLTAAVWNWQKLYSEIVREYMLGKANSVKRHWFGIDTGVVGLSEYSSLVSEETKEQIETAKKEILSGKDVFSGIIYDNEGKLRCDEGENISDEILLEKMNWYVDGVVIDE
jgi:basic membrane protein A